MQTRSSTSLVLLAAALGACEKKPPPPPPAPPTPPVVTITATEYAFQAPDTITAGLTTFRLIPAGKELHHAVLIKIGEGKTLADFQQGMQEAIRSKGPMKTPPWISLAGGVNAAIGADTGEVTQLIEPGLYAMVCFIPGADGVPHVAKGMLRQLVVVPAAAGAVAAAEPTADVTMRLVDYDFVITPALTAGRHTIRVENAGPQVHEVEIAELAAGKTVADVVAWEKGGAKGPPPVSRWIGGMAPADSGKYAFITVNFTPGHYALLCFVEDSKDGKSHMQHGMAKDVMVS